MRVFKAVLGGKHEGEVEQGKVSEGMEASGSPPSLQSSAGTGSPRTSWVEESYIKDGGNHPLADQGTMGEVRRDGGEEGG